MRNFYADGAFAIEQGYVYTSIILAATIVCIIEKQFRQASYWVFVAAILAALGFTHQYTFTFSDTISVLKFELNDWFWSYLIVAVVLYITPWITNDGKEEITH